MTVLLFVYVFVMGFAMGFLVQNLIEYYRAKQRKKAVTKLIDAIKKYASNVTDNIPESVLERLKRAQKIESEQLEMAYANEGPQRGILDGRSRNQISGQIKKLSEEKLELLQSILREGHDPSITVMNEGKRENMKLSEYMKLNNKVYSEDTAEEKPVEKPKTKLTLVKNKDE